MFRLGAVACLRHELAEAAIGDREFIDHKGLQRYGVYGAFSIVGKAKLIVRSHEERSAGQIYHLSSHLRWTLARLCLNRCSDTRSLMGGRGGTASFCGRTTTRWIGIGTHVVILAFCRGPRLPWQFESMMVVGMTIFNVLAADTPNGFELEADGRCISWDSIICGTVLQRV